MDSMNRLSNMVAMLTNRVSQQQGMAAGNGGNSGENGGGADAAVGNVYIECIQSEIKFISRAKLF